MIAIADNQGDDTRRVDALLGSVSLYLDTEPAKASDPLEQALEIARELGDIGREGTRIVLFWQTGFFPFRLLQST